MSTRLEPGDLGEAAPTLLDGETGQRVIGGLLLLVLLILIGSALWVSQRALDAFDELLLPEFDRDAEIIAERLASDLDRAARLGIRVTHLSGVDRFLEGYLGEHPALVYLGIGDGDGQLLASVGPAAAALRALPLDAELPTATRRSVTLNEADVRRTSVQVVGAGQAYAVVHVGMDRSYAEQQVADIRWDIVVVLVVSLLVTFELLVFVIDRTMTTPLKLIDRAIARATQGEWTTGATRRRAGDEVGGLLGAVDDTGRRIQERLDALDAKLARLQTVPAELAAQVDGLRRRLRWRVATEVDRPVESRANARFTLFLFVFAAELSRSFLPLYAQSIFRPIDELGGLGALLVDRPRRPALARGGDRPADHRLHSGHRDRHPVRCQPRRLLRQPHHLPHRCRSAAGRMRARAFATISSGGTCRSTSSSATATRRQPPLRASSPRPSGSAPICSIPGAPPRR